MSSAVNTIVRMKSRIQELLGNATIKQITDAHRSSSIVPERSANIHACGKFLNWQWVQTESRELENQIFTVRKKRLQQVKKRFLRWCVRGNMYTKLKHMTLLRELYTNL